VNRLRRRGERGASGARFAIVFVVVAAVLAVAFYGVDAYAHARVEREVAARLQTSLATPQPPSVEIAGRPFLTQVVARRIGSVHMVADDVGQTDAQTLHLQQVDMTLQDVTTTDWWKTMTAASAKGTALVDYDALKQVAGVPLEYSGNGRFTVSGDQNLYGITVKATITGGLALDADKQTVSLAEPTVQIAGYTLPEVVADQLIKAVVRPIPLEGIPFDLKVTSIEAQDDGLHVGIAGTDIPIQR
jgi:hypothetical protein